MLGKFGRKEESNSRNGVPHNRDPRWTMKEGAAPLNPMKTTQKRTSKEIAHVFSRFFENIKPYERLREDHLKTEIALENTFDTGCHIRNNTFIQQGLIFPKMSVAIRVRSG